MYMINQTEVRLKITDLKRSLAVAMIALSATLVIVTVNLASQEDVYADPGTKKCNSKSTTEIVGCVETSQAGLTALNEEPSEEEAPSNGASKPVQQNPSNARGPSGTTVYQFLPCCSLHAVD